MALWRSPCGGADAQVAGMSSHIAAPVQPAAGRSAPNLCQHAVKAVLVVNTTSCCGFTGQYEGLEKLYAQYRSKGLVVLGFPSNYFGRQVPGSSAQTADFCCNTYGVQFPVFSKSVVPRGQRNSLYAALYKATGTAPS